MLNGQKIVVVMPGVPRVILRSVAARRGLTPHPTLRSGGTTRYHGRIGTKVRDEADVPVSPL